PSEESHRSDTTTAPEGTDTGGTAEKRVRKRAAKADAGTTPNESARGEAVAEQKPAAEPAPAAPASQQESAQPQGGDGGDDARGNQREGRDQQQREGRAEERRGGKGPG